MIKNKRNKDEQKEIEKTQALNRQENEEEEETKNYDSLTHKSRE